MAYEIDFLPVGDSNGDAICIRYTTPLGGQVIHVVDGGFVDTGPRIVQHLNTYYGNPAFIDHVVLSHADQDHAGGLISLFEHFAVGTLWMNRPWLHAHEVIDSFHGNYTVDGLIQDIRRRHPALVELERLAQAQGTQINDVFAGAEIGAFRVLAPIRDRYIQSLPEHDRTPTAYGENALQQGAGLLAHAFRAVRQWVEDWHNEQLEEDAATSASNESCVVQFGIIENQRILLTADVGPIGLAEAANVASYFDIFSSPTIVQIPHHGSRRNVTPTVLNRWLGLPVPFGTRRGTAFCSVGSNKPQYPRHRVRNAFLRRGYEVISTRETWKRSSQGYPRVDEVRVESEPFSFSYEE